MKAKVISCITIVAVYSFLWVGAITHVPNFNEPGDSFSLTVNLAMTVLGLLSFCGVIALAYYTIRWAMK